MDTHKNPHVRTIRRAALPEILFVPDLALAFSIKESAVRKAVVRGDYGPYVRIGRRLAVRRTSLLKAIEAREMEPERAARSPSRPHPKRKYIELLRDRRGRRRRGR